jgi:hypothetical protein
LSELCGLVRPNFGGDPARWSVATIPRERDGEDRKLRSLEAKYKTPNTPVRLCGAHKSTESNRPLLIVAQGAPVKYATLELCSFDGAGKERKGFYFFRDRAPCEIRFTNPTGIFHRARGRSRK